MIRMKDICVSFRSERQEKIFGVSRTQVLFDVSLRSRREAALESLENPEAENQRLAV